MPGPLVGKRPHVLDDGEGVGEHVFVAVDRILFQSHRRQFGQEVVGQARVDTEPQPGAGRRHDDELVEFVADALGRHDLEPLGHRPHGLDQVGLGLQLEPGDEPRCPQHAQRIVAEALGRRQRRAQHLGEQIDGATEGVDQHRVGGGEFEGHRVDREVASRQVDLDVVGVRHVGLARIRAVHLGPVRRDLVGALDDRSVRQFGSLQGTDRAEPLALGPDGVGPAVQQALDLVGASVGGGVEVVAIG